MVKTTIEWVNSRFAVSIVHVLDERTLFIQHISLYTPLGKKMILHVQMTKTRKSDQLSPTYNHKLYMLYEGSV